MILRRWRNDRAQYFTPISTFAAGYRLFFYAAGTSTKQNTYADSTGSAFNTNPIVLDENGMVPLEVWMLDAVGYKALLASPGTEDPPSSTVWSEDNITGINSTPLNTNLEWTAFAGVPTYLSPTSLSLAGDQTTLFHPHRRVRLVCTAGTRYATILTAIYSSTTVLTLLMDSGSLDTGLSAISYGTLAYTPSSVPDARPVLWATLAASASLSSGQLPGKFNVTAAADITLPAAGSVSSGTLLQIKSSTYASVRAIPSGADTIDAVSGAQRVPALRTLSLESDGLSNWIVTFGVGTQVGFIEYSASPNTPLGWLNVDNAPFSRTTYSGLFAELGTTWGAGDGSTTFGENLKGTRGPIAAGSGGFSEAVSGAASANALPVASNSAKWLTGQAVTVTGSGYTGLANGSYFAIRVSSTRVAFASSMALAQAGTALVVTGTSSATLSVSLTARALGEIGGEEGHLQVLSEIATHTHTVGTKTNPNPGASTGIGLATNTPDGTSTSSSTGGSTPMNTMQPYAVYNAFIKA